MRRHYPVQVHGSLALARQTLSVTQRRFGSPNLAKLERFTRNVKQRAVVNLESKCPAESEIAGQIGTVAANAGTGQHGQQEVVIQVKLKAALEIEICRATCRTLRNDDVSITDERPASV